MKHIRKFNIESKDLEDLEDYLQEIFDKYHIRKSQPTGQESDVDMLSVPIPIYYTKIDINGNESLFLDNLEFKFYYNLLEDIRKLKPTIEKRLGYRIDIFPDQYIDFIKIVPLPKKLLENIEPDVRSFNAEDYEDYLLSEISESKIVHIDKSKNFLYVLYSGESHTGISYAESYKLQKYFDTNLRFKDTIILSDWVGESDAYFQVLIIDRFFYTQNQKYLVKNLHWDEHDVTKAFKSIDFGNIDPELFKHLSFSDAKKLNGTPPGISIIKGISKLHSNQIELMMSGDSDPTYLDEHDVIGLQYFILKALENDIY